MTLPTLAVTTSVHPPPELEAQTQAAATELSAHYVPRMGRSLPALFAASDAERLLIVGADRLRLRDRTTESEYFFHPNLFQIRGANVRRGVPDHFLQAAGLTAGDSLLDCTLGFASEASLAALIVGERGRVVGLESVPELAFVTRKGLQTFELAAPELQAALRRVQVVTADSADYLANCETDAFDVVYFDPFFDHRLTGSEASVSPLFVFGNPAPLSPQAVGQAQRVARRRVVIKHPRHAPLPEPLTAWVTETVGSRKSRVVYSVLETKK